MPTLLNSTGLSPAGYADAVGTDARFDTPQGLAISRDGARLYVADMNNHLIRRMHTLGTTQAVQYTVETFAGTVRNYSVDFDYLAARVTGAELPGCVPPC
jgi:sugar lactone lactonase YvrE